MTSATNETRIAAGRARAKDDAKLTAKVIGALMSTVEGRRWVWLELEAANIFMVVEGMPADRLLYHSGKRDQALRLYRQVTRHAPSMYIRMTQENTGVQLDEGQTDDDNA